MKGSIKLFCIAVTILLTASNSFSTPLNGTYTIGNGGNYPTINSAANDVILNGVNGPVVFNIIPGFYDEHIEILSIPGSSKVNTVTFKSQTGNQYDVVITNSKSPSVVIFILGGVNNIIIKDLTFTQTTFYAQKIYITAGCKNLKIINNIFRFESGFAGEGIDILTNNPISNLTISKNTFNSRNTNNIIISQTDSLYIENNNFATTYSKDNSISASTNFKISGNTFNGNGSIGVTSCFDSLTPKLIINNIINGGFLYCDYVNNVKIINNTINSHGYYKSLLIMHSDVSVINNLIISEANIAYYNISVTLVSDYNVIYNSGSLGLIKYDFDTYDNVPDFYSATGLDQHSNSFPVTFASPNDLHLSGSSIGNQQLTGIPNSLVTDDIDGQPRNPLHPYKGADEVSDYPLPVELASFTSSVSNSNVKLNWTTASEINNLGFDLERRDARSETQDVWNKISFINGHGTTTSPNNYEFTDRNLSSGKYKYRLKQIDFNGNFEYHILSDEVVVGVPEKFEMSQNYPNPFNPSTVIRYSLSENSFVTLKVYDVIGNEVATLVNEKQNSGTYNYQFSTVNYQLASGVYFYKIEAGSFSDVKRMILLK